MLIPPFVINSVENRSLGGKVFCFLEVFFVFLVDNLFASAYITYIYTLVFTQVVSNEFSPRGLMRGWDRRREPLQ